MIQVLEMKGKLKPIHEVANAIQQQHPHVFAMQDIIHYLQLAVYWFEGAAEKLYTVQNNDDLAYSENEPGVPWPPTPEEVKSDTRLQLVYLFDKLEELEKQAFAFVDSTGMEHLPKFYLEGAIQRIIEAKMGTILAGLQYERLQTIRANNKGLLG
jgi:hypothetical protein